jgi:hypothetical protein
MRIATVCGMTVMTVLVWPALYPASAQESFDSWRLSGVTERGREMAPLSLNLEGKNPQLVYLGSYIVNGQGGCNSCHTCPSFRPSDVSRLGASGPTSGKTSPTLNIVNYLGGGVPFNGIKSSNLTPDGAGLPGGLTYKEFLTSMQNGHRHEDAAHTVQISPLPNFSDMFEGDVAAVYEYLRALPAAVAGACSRAGETAPN